MSSPIANLLNRGQAALHTWQGCPQFTWLGTAYDCATTIMKRGTAIVVGGVEVEIMFTIIVPVCALEDVTTPTAGKTLTYNNVTYRIARVGHAPGASHYELDLISPNK